MKISRIVGFCLAAGVGAAQGPTISITPHGSPNPNATAKLASKQDEKRVATAGAAVLGYVLGPGPAEVHPIFGTAQRPLLGEQAVVPVGATRLYMPPRQQYVLVEESANEPVAVWTLHRSVASNEATEPVVLNGAMAHPDLVAFSPRGDAAVLYSEAAAALQLVTHLPAEPALGKQISMAGLGTPSELAVTDDGALVAALADHRLSFSLNGAAWRPLVIGYTPEAWTFIPKTHDLAISDSAQKTLGLLSNLSEVTPAFRVLAQGLAADSLAVTKNGDELVAANLKAGELWTIDVKTATVTPRDGFGKLDTLSPLRDGFTFLLSASPNMSLLKLAVSPDTHDLGSSSGTTGGTQDAKGGR
jgi:hypothetical protein